MKEELESIEEVDLHCIKCTGCGWIGNLSEILFDPEIHEERCPVCHSTEHLEDVSVENE